MKLSIVTATFNSEKTVRDTITSVLSQTYQDFEYILVDGASKDGTLDIIKEYEPQFNGRMRWISEKDNGLYDAMNKGIKMAKGEIVGIINSDDLYFNSSIIQQVADAFIDDNIDAIIADLCFVNPNNLKKIIRYYSAKHWNPNRFKWGFMPPHPTFYCRKEFFEKYGYYRLGYKIAADYELMARFFYTHQLRYKYLPVNMLYMRPGGVSTKNLKSKLVLNKEVIRACKENGIYTNLFVLSLKYFVKLFEFIRIKQ